MKNVYQENYFGALTFHSKKKLTDDTVCMKRNILQAEITKVEFSHRNNVNY